LSKLTAGFDSRVLVSARSKTKIQFNGRERTSADETPASVRPDHDRAVSETAVLNSGARLAAKLNAKIIMNDTEFNHAGEMSVDDRHLYHEALEAVFPPNIAVSTSESEPRKIRHNKVLLIVVVVSILAGAVYLWLHSFFG
jgi:hypothetical protein